MSSENTYVLYNKSTNINQNKRIMLIYRNIIFRFYFGIHTRECHLLRFDRFQDDARDLAYSEESERLNQLPCTSIMQRVSKSNFEDNWFLIHHPSCKREFVWIRTLDIFGK